MSTKKDKKPRTYKGEWTIPDGKIKLPGILTIDENKFTQSLRLFSKVDFNGNKIQNDGFDNGLFPTIIGHLEINQKATLTNCRIMKMIHFGDDLYEISINLSFTFYGGIFSNQENLKVNRLICSFPYLNTWFDTNRLFFGVPYSTENFLEKMKPSLKTEDLLEEIKIDDEISIIIEREYRDNLVTINSSDLNLELKHFVHFCSTKPRAFKDLQEYANQFMQLIKLSTGKLMYVNLVSTIVEKTELNDYSKSFETVNGDIHISIFNYSSFHRRNLVKSEYIHQHNMLFYGGYNRTERLKDIIVRWFRTYKKYAHIYNLYIDTLEWFQETDAGLSEVMFNNRFVNLVQGLESFHILKFENSAQIENERKNAFELIKQKLTKIEDREWLDENVDVSAFTLRERLNDLMNEKFETITKELFLSKTKKKDFLNKVIKFRNHLSHGAEYQLDSGKTSDYYYKSLILLTACILLNLGFTAEEIKKELFRTQKYARIISYMKNNN